MDTKKLLKETKSLLEGSQPSKKVSTAKEATLKEQTVTPLKRAAKKSITENNNPAGLKIKPVANKPTKPSTGKSKQIDITKPASKKLKAPVKKAPITNTSESQEPVVSKKEAAADKKSKAGVAAERETKPSKPSSKVAKPEGENKLVVIPKTTTDKKVDYEPDFMKSVLDTPATAPAGPTMRYSDVELQEFRDLISKKLDAAKKELAYLQGLITRRDEMGGDETDNRYMTMEDGGMSMEREQLSQMASRQITFIDHLEKALMRIENKTYGICRITGKLIDKARLRAVPHATLSMEAKMGISK
ncbi:MAG: DnaK suppressor protein, putative [uncultured Segetibacter sp.]|uniref:DnaK suppressor protein, putative n=1 Tax=uncultured Segetibacter sp. TaxID=481133 RepID=A0A6J4U6V7_9BACT|nr:MAG: DnaK suppressor protein, putative [uncultured Segetibacter sp.]